MESALSHLTRVYLVEDSFPIRERLLEMLGDIDGVEVVGTEDTAAGAAEGILKTRPDLVVLDIRLTSGSGIDVLRQVHPLAPGIVFIVLTNFASPQYQSICTKAGARHFIDKSTQIDRVKHIVADYAAALDGISVSGTNSTL